MADAGLTTTIILSEIILIETTLILGWLLYLFFIKKKKSAKLGELLKSFISDKDSRSSTISKTFTKPDSMTDDKYKTIIHSIMEGEDIFFKYLADTFYNNDVTKLDSLAVEIKKIIMPSAEFFSTETIENGEPVPSDDISEIDVDNAIDEFLSDDEDFEFDEDKDPALDLSKPENDADKTTEETDIKNDEIAEIPSELLTTASPETEAEAEAEKPATESKPNNEKTD